MTAPSERVIGGGHHSAEGPPSPACELNTGVEAARELSTGRIAGLPVKSAL
jgi:hypothetical protein